VASPRYLFGSGVGDFAIAPPSRHGGFVVSAPSLGNGTLWSASSGGTQYTDLQTINGGATSTINTDANGSLVSFYGPPGVDGAWLDFGGGARVFVSANHGQDKHLADLLGDDTSSAAAAVDSRNQTKGDARYTQKTGLDADVSAAVNSGSSSTRTALDGRYATRPGNSKNALTGWYHADGFGAVGDGTADDTAAIQAAIDAAGAAGGGRVYLKKGTYKVTAGLLLPSKVALVGDSAGGQVGNSTKISYAGAAGGTLLSPKDRTVDTINWKIEGIDFDGGGLAGIVVEFYRVSYSRMQDCAVYGVQASTGVGVLLDANTNNQCYFNVIDNVKVDGAPTGARFQRGANANRWVGGKIGNGGTGMEFLSVSSGNIIIATDMENNSVRHVYMDAGANVFYGIHMEVSPLGFVGTTNAAGWHHSGSTIASQVTTPFSDASTVGAGLDAVTTDTYELRVGGTKLQSKMLSTSTQVTFDPAPYSNTASILVNLFRNVTTSGAKQINIYKGDGTSSKPFCFDYGTATLSVGDVGLGGGVGGIGILNRTTAPATNPAGGGFLYAESGALRYKTSVGTVRTVAGDVVSKSANYTATNADSKILATGGTSGITITLPAATLGAEYVIKKVDAGAGAVTVATTSSQTIDGATTKALTTQWASVRVVSDGTAWFVF
jgi:hypothetical protein